MSLRRALAFLVLTAAFVLGSLIAWWVIPAIGLLWGALRPAVRRPALTAGWAAALAWTLWVVLDVVQSRGAFGPFLTRFAGLFSVPGPLLLVLTVAFAGLLAWSAAALAGGVRGRGSESGSFLTPDP